MIRTDSGSVKVCSTTCWCCSTSAYCIAFYCDNLCIFSGITVCHECTYYADQMTLYMKLSIAHTWHFIFVTILCFYILCYVWNWRLEEIYSVKISVFVTAVLLPAMIQLSKKNYIWQYLNLAAQINEAWHQLCQWEKFHLLVFCLKCFHLFCEFTELRTKNTYETYYRRSRIWLYWMLYWL